MKRLTILMLVSALTIVLSSVSGAPISAGMTVASGSPTATNAPAEPQGNGDIPALTDGEPIHMPNLLGHSLEYSTSIWDSDEPLPQIVVEGANGDPRLVVVRQRPLPGTLIVPEHTQIVLALGLGPVVQPSPSPTPLPRLSAAVAALGQATLLRSPYLQNLKPTMVTIVWTTAADGASEVDYGTSDYGLAAPATSTFFTTPAAAPYHQYYVHQATLSGLAPDTVYQYKIFTNGADLTPGGSVTFRSGKPPTADHFRLAVLGDSGDGSQNQKDVATRLLQVQPDLVVHTGDMIYPEARYDLFETRFFQIYKDLLKSVWFVPTMGNHDVSYNNGKSFTDVFVNPPNGTSQNELYYSFDYGDAHFVVLDNYFSMNAVGSTQYNWLVSDLAASNQYWKFVFFHEPAYASNGSQQPHDDANTVQNLVPLFEQYHVNVVFSGHWHNYERMKPLLGGRVSTIEAGAGVYLVTGGGGAGLAGVGLPPWNPRTAAKVQQFHLTLVEVNGCSPQFSAVQKVSGSGDSFDPGDIFDQYTLDRCDGSQTPTLTPTSSPSATSTSTPTNTSIPSDTPTPTPTFTLTPSDTPTRTPTNTFVFPTVTPTSTSSSVAPTATNTPTRAAPPTNEPSGRVNRIYLPLILLSNH